MKVEVEIPQGKYCTGCLFNEMSILRGEYYYGCRLLHRECGGEGEYKTQQVKHLDCPSLKELK